MSFTRKATDPFVVISANDEAIDRETLAGKLGLRRYISERDTDHLVLLPGGRPARFHCRPLSNAARTAIEGVDSAALRFTMAFAACVDRVEDLGFSWLPKLMPAGWAPDARCLEQACIDELAEAIGGKVVEEVGSVCLQRANLSPKCGGGYALPPGYVVASVRSTSALSPTIQIEATHESGSG